MVYIRKRWVTLVPFALSTVVFALALVVLTAGNKPGYNEDLAIIRVCIVYDMRNLLHSQTEC